MSPASVLLLSLCAVLITQEGALACDNNPSQVVNGGPDCIYIINAPKKAIGCCPSLLEAAQHVIDHVIDDDDEDDGGGGDVDLIAYYPLDSDSNDHSGNNRNGVDRGEVTYDDDAICGHSRFFDGASKIDVESFRQFVWSDRFSVSVWFKRTNSRNYQGIVNNGYWSTGSWEIRMGRENGGRMLGGGVVTNDDSTTWDYINLKPALNEWHHVAMTYDGASLRYYLDGVSQSGDDDCCTGPILTRDNPVTIGQAGTGMNREFFYGYIDEVKLFSKALTPGEVQQLYENPCPN